MHPVEWIEPQFAADGELMAAHSASDSLVFTASRGGPLFRSTFAWDVWRPAVTRAGLSGLTFHGLRHSFVAILVAAGCNVREVSEWAGHNSVAFTLTRYGGLFEAGPAEAVERLDALLSPTPHSSPLPIADSGPARQVHMGRPVGRSKDSR